MWKGGGPYLMWQVDRLSICYALKSVFLLVRHSETQGNFSKSVSYHTFSKVKWWTNLVTTETKKSLFQRVELCQETIQSFFQYMYSYDYLPKNTQFYGCSRVCSCPVGPWCSMGLGRNPLINGLIQHNFKIHFLFVKKKIIVILFD